MSRIFGEIRQLGYVVEDIEAEMAHWSEKLGIGPWFYAPRVPIENYFYRGAAYEPHNSVALANSGFIQCELIQCRNDVPSMYRDFLQAGHTGLQHVAYWTRNYDEDLARAASHGFQPVMGGEVGAKGRFCYFDTESHPGTVVELSEVIGPKGRMFDLIRDAARDWDGSHPVRPFPDFSKL